MLTSHVPPSIDSKRFLTSYPWSGSSARSPSTPYLSDKFHAIHTEYACRVCICPAGAVKDRVSTWTVELDSSAFRNRDWSRCYKPRGRETRGQNERSRPVASWRRCLGATR